MAGEEGPSARRAMGESRAELFFGLSDFQREVTEWNALQPWANDPPVVVVVGLGEETGEVQRAVLKQHQGIRGTHDEWQAEAEKECGDVIIKLAALANAMGFSLAGALEARWAEISQRNFTANPQGHGLPKEDE